MIYKAKDHTFCICAYGENAYLEECIQSLMNQTIRGNILIATSTPTPRIAALAGRYRIPVVQNEGSSCIGDDFNAAYQHPKTDFVTICHQDDWYAPGYLERLLEYANRNPEMILFFTDYAEKRQEGIVEQNLLLQIKRCMLSPLRLAPLQSCRWLRRLLLSVGNPICCPSVTFHKTRIEGQPFDSRLKTSLDWKCWLTLAKQKGKFVYCPEKLMVHRIWEGSATTETIERNIRNQEDFEILSSLWPGWAARMIFAVYRRSQNSNRIGNAKDEGS